MMRASKQAQAAIGSFAGRRERYRGDMHAGEIKR